MTRRSFFAVALGLLAMPLLRAQEFKLLDRTVQVHGFVSQGFIATQQNNWLSMNTSAGSFAMTDFGVNMSSQITDKFRVGFQIYDRNVGHLGQWHPEIDWAYADYRLADWFGLRGGKVKTTLGLYTDTQDLNFLHPWAILPQSMYSLDLRTSTIAHLGGDLYGHARLPKKLGTVDYTAYVGRRSQDPRGGYVLGIAAIGLDFENYGGWIHGEDLRWTTPVPGLLLGASRMNLHGKDNGVYHADHATDPFLSVFHLPDGALESDHSIKDDFTQFYVQYTRGRLRLESEYRREWRLYDITYAAPSGVWLNNFPVPLDQRSGYGSAALQVSKKLQLGTYFSWYFTDYSQDLSLPVNHVYDRDITARYDFNPHLNLKLEGHFIDGYGRFDSIRGFYGQFNPQGLQTQTNAVVAKTGFNF